MWKSTLIGSATLFVGANAFADDGAGMQPANSAFAPSSAKPRRRLASISMWSSITGFICQERQAVIYPTAVPVCALKAKLPGAAATSRD